MSHPMSHPVTPGGMTKKSSDDAGWQGMSHPVTPLNAPSFTNVNYCPAVIRTGAKLSRPAVLATSNRESIRIGHNQRGN